MNKRSNKILSLGVEISRIGPGCGVVVVVVYDRDRDPCDPRTCALTNCLTIRTLSIVHQASVHRVSACDVREITVQHLCAFIYFLPIYYVYVYA